MCLSSKADDYIKYFDGLKPIFGKSMITHDGALWQKIRMPQQPAFHPDMFAEYIPYFLQAIRTKMDLWVEARRNRRVVRDGRADLDARRRHDLQGAVRPRHAVQPALRLQVRQDLHRRDEHKAIRLQRAHGEDGVDITEEDAAKAMEIWASVPPAVFAPNPREDRERTLLKMIEAVVADPSDPRIRPAAGRRRDQAIPLGRHRNDGPHARLGACTSRPSTRKPPTASARKARQSMATASRPPPIIRPSPTPAP